MRAPSFDIGPTKPVKARKRSMPLRGASEGVSAPSDAPSEEEAFALAWAKLLRLLAAREHSTVSAREKLEKAGFAAPIVDQAIQRALDLRFLDDYRYADALVRSRIYAGKGLVPAMKEIEALGIDPHELDAFCEYHEEGEDAEVERALALLERKPPRCKNLREGAYRKLIQAGFCSSAASEASRLWVNSQASHQ